MDQTKVELTVIGCGDAFGSGGRFNTCFMLDSSGERLLIDCGASSLVAMKRLGISPDSIGTICITHLHGDHYAGLAFMLREAGLYKQRTLPLTIAGPPGIEARVEAALQVLFPLGEPRPLHFPISFQELAPRAPTPVGPAEVTAFTADHYSGAPSYSLRVTFGGKTVSYTGDTLWVDDLAELARDADLLICEAYSWETPRGKHLDYATIRKNAQLLGARNTLLTHLGPDILARVDELELPVASDGMRMTVE